MLLRANDIETLVLFGIATSGVVFPTLREAADYRLVVIKDCCADLDPELHACLFDRLFPAQAQILTANEFLGHLDSLTSSQCSAAMSLRTASASPIKPFL
jgi:nicotinamidase-related amidase